QSLRRNLPRRRPLQPRQRLPRRHGRTLRPRRQHTPPPDRVAVRTTQKSRRAEERKIKTLTLRRLFPSSVLPLFISFAFPKDPHAPTRTLATLQRIPLPLQWHRAVARRVAHGLRR